MEKKTLKKKIDRYFPQRLILCYFCGDSLWLNNFDSKSKKSSINQVKWIFRDFRPLKKYNKTNSQKTLNEPFGLPFRTVLCKWILILVLVDFKWILFWKITKFESRVETGFQSVRRFEFQKQQFIELEIKWRNSNWLGLRLSVSIYWWSFHDNSENKLNNSIKWQDKLYHITWSKWINIPNDVKSNQLPSLIFLM